MLKREPEESRADDRALSLTMTAERRAAGEPDGAGGIRRSAATVDSAGRLVSALSASLGTLQRVRTVADALARYTADDETYYQAHYTHTAANGVVRPFDDVRGAYILGHLAAFTAESSGDVWQDLEPRLADTWALVDPAEWSVVRDFALSAYRRASSLDYRLWRSRALDVDDVAEISPDPNLLVRWRGNVGDKIDHHSRC